ncbi:MAG TPA: SMP-30/gluconolactonase/LRE family protein [Thermomicrobiales bacterium]|nr:SMP-30/gluconolactonase/LRE family protein [Thermomicrobiales bacterium]
MRSPVNVLISGYDSPEGPAFDREGNLYFVNWLSSSIIRLTPDGNASEFFNTFGIPAGLAFHRDGSLYVADESDDIHGVLRIADGQMTILVNEYEGQRLNGANDLVFDSSGVLYFSDPWRSSADNPIGGFYRLFPNGTLERIDHGLAFPNGVALSANGDAAYLAETYRNRILRYPIEPDGAIGAREDFAILPGGEGPDGMAFDQAGNLYVAHYGGGQVAVFGPSGEMIDEIPVPGAQVTNVAFGGADRRALVITDVATASLYQTRVDVPGLALFG